MILRFVKKYSWNFIKKACSESSCPLLSSSSNLEKLNTTMNSLKNQCKKNKQCLNNLNDLFTNEQVNTIKANFKFKKVEHKKLNLKMRGFGWL